MPEHHAQWQGKAFRGHDGSQLEQLPQDITTSHLEHNPHKPRWTFYDLAYEQHLWQQQHELRHQQQMSLQQPPPWPQFQLRPDDALGVGSSWQGGAAFSEASVEPGTSQAPIHADSISHFSASGSSTEKFIGTSSGFYLLSELLLSAGLPVASPWPYLGFDRYLALMKDKPVVSSLPIPSKKSVSAMLDMYYDLVAPTYPVFSRVELAKMLDAIFLNSSIVRRDIDETTLNTFALIMSLVLGILSRQNPSLTRMSNDFLAFARCALCNLFMRPTLEGLKLVLSIVLVDQAQESIDYICFATGLAMQIAIDLGLHVARPSAVEVPSQEEIEEEDERRRVFWTAYTLDRGLCLVYGRPIVFLDSSFTCPYPTNVSPSVLSRIKVRKIQSLVTKHCQQMEQQPARSFPTVEELQYLSMVGIWNSEASGTTEERLQAGNTELLIYRRGVQLKDYEATQASVSIIQRNLELYQEAGIQIAVVEGLPVVHELFMNCITLLYIYRFGVGHNMTYRQMQDMVEKARPIFQDLSGRWSTALESLQIIDSVMSRLCA